MNSKSPSDTTLAHIAAPLRPLARPIAELHEDPANVRRHPEKNAAAIRGSLARFGQQKPIVARSDGTVLAGNGTLGAARELGWQYLAVVVTDLVGADAIAYAIADNRSGELAVWDLEGLDALLKEIEKVDPGAYAATGFTDGDIDELLREAESEGGGGADGQTDPDAIPEPPDEAVTRPGDLWILGGHRLLCGDSSKSADVDRLLAGAQIHLVNTDPPYNVKVEPRSNNAIAAGLSSFEATHHQKLDLARHPEKSEPTTKKLRAKDRPLMNDFVTEEAFDAMLRAWFGNIARVLLPGRCFYIWGGYANCANYPPVLRDCELYFSQSLIWVKEHPVLTRKDFMGNHEWCFYGWRKGAGHEFLGPNNVTDVWSVKKVNPQSMIHLTEKPVELATRAIEFSSRRGENILDLFGGSGSTLIGAEKMGRHAFLMELDPLYCDVIVRRWEEFTGRKAERRPAAEAA
jgi:DNA modification methylase